MHICTFNIEHARSFWGHSVNFSQNWGLTWKWHLIEGNGRNCGALWVYLVCIWVLLTLKCQGHFGVAWCTFLKMDGNIVIVHCTWCDICKSAWNDIKGPWHVQGQKYQYGCYIYPRGQIFVHFTIRRAVIELRPNFEKRVPNDHKKTLTCSRSKVTYAYYIHLRGPNKFSSVYLYDEAFSSYTSI